MMTDKDIELLCREDVRQAIEQHIGDDPVRIALNAKIPAASLVATQVKYLRRAKDKLPSYYASRCILPSLSFEQSSSEVSAACRTWEGDLCIDLTCGLGVDSLFLSRRFRKVIALERDEALARVARINFERLNANNIEVVNRSAEDFLSDPMCPKADLIYADPDRRSSDGHKLVVLEDCSPNVVALMPRMKELAKSVAVKCSPLFDVAEAFRKFGDQVRVTVVSISGECKEVIIEIDPQISTPQIIAEIAGGQRESFDANGTDDLGIADIPLPEELRYLVIPDVALRKGRVAARYLSRKGIYHEGGDPLGFAAIFPEDIMGRTMEIERIEEYRPKELKRRLKMEKCRSINVVTRNFPTGASGVAAALGVKEGGRRTMVFTQFGRKFVAIILR